MKPDFHGKVAIVTGAGSGIGAAVSRQLAQEGAEVVVADIDAEAAHGIAAEIRSQGGRAQDFAVDVTDAAAVEKLVEFAVQKCGGLDMAVNNAGIDGVRKVTADYPLDNWHKLINVNLNGVFYCMKYEIAAMLDRGGGAIVNMSSILGSVGIANCVRIHGGETWGRWTDQGCGDRICEDGHPNQCRRPRLDRNATFVGAGGSSGQPAHGRPSADGQARETGRGSRLLCASSCPSRLALSLEATIWWTELTPPTRHSDRFHCSSEPSFVYCRLHSGLSSIRFGRSRSGSDRTMRRSDLNVRNGGRMLPIVSSMGTSKVRQKPATCWRATKQPPLSQMTNAMRSSVTFSYHLARFFQVLVSKKVLGAVEFVVVSVLTN